MISMNFESRVGLPLLLGVTLSGSAIAFGGTISISRGTGRFGLVRALDSLFEPTPSLLTLLMESSTLDKTRPWRLLLSPSSSDLANGNVDIGRPASATSCMLALRLPSLRLVMLPVPSACRRVSACPPMKPPAGRSGLEWLLFIDVDLARGLCSRDLSQFLTLVE